ncbi:MAG: universal stress protein [Alphaproteobacteria bacterium]
MAGMTPERTKKADRARGGSGARRRDDFAVRRILIALDSSPHSVAALDEAAGLAQRLHAELIGLFVEDINLINLADLPGTPGVSRLTAAREDPDARIRHELRALATRARIALEAASRRTGVPASFHVSRGRVAAELIRAADKADLLIMGWSGRSWADPFEFRRMGARSARLGGTARRVASESARSVLLLRRGTRMASPLMVAYDGSAGANRALAAAIRVGIRDHDPLAVLILADDAQGARKLTQRARGWLDRRGLAARFLFLEKATPGQLCAKLGEAGASLLVLNADSPLLAGPPGETLLDRISCPAMLVR